MSDLKYLLVGEHLPSLLTSGTQSTDRILGSSVQIGLFSSLNARNGRSRDLVGSQALVILLRTQLGVIIRTASTDISQRRAGGFAFSDMAVTSIVFGTISGVARNDGGDAAHRDLG